MKFKWKSISAIAILVLLSVVPAYSQFEGVDEETIGKETDKKIVAQFGLYDNPELQKYVQRVGRKVLSAVSEPGFEYHFKLLDHEMINAFALPGGYIYVTRGLLAALNSEAALAGVLGHEIGHVIGHHAVKQMKKSMSSLLLTLAGLAASQEVRENAAAWLTVTSSLSSQILMGYGREMEMESDQVGMSVAYDSGYTPSGIVDFLNTMRDFERLGARGYHGFQATHPDTIKRIIDAEGKADILKARGGPIGLFRDRYLDAIDGLRYGKPKARKRTLPPYKIKIHTVKEGETFRSIAEDSAKDKGLALIIATLNAMDHNTPLKAGYRIKTLVPEESVTQKLMEVKEDEVGAGDSDGEVKQDGGPKSKGPK
ncbi:hypothetical protein MNBD_NITROSPINAE01-527 [hydrothermal vent metagenome]|uniref:LysM domain-containing protein n=1 Tax=hydrothermal vent metagenome TaxID=652676 RepID=A0A3B1C1E1_9ZZZZ